MISRVVRACASAALAALLPTAAHAASPAVAPRISDEVVRIGVLTDMSGLYSDQNGAGSVAAVRMAVEDFGGSVLGKRIDVIYADHQNKADVASNLAREWFDTQKVDLIANLGPSHTALAVAEMAK